MGAATTREVRASLLAALVGIAFAGPGCVKRVEPAAPGVRAVQLLAEAPEKDTTQLTTLRTDLEFDTRDFDRTPHVVATGETPLLDVTAMDAKLYGDAQGTLGFSVDNCMLLELLGPDGRLLGRAVVGFTDGLLSGNERLDSLGPRSFAFEPGEVNLAPLLGEHQAVRLRATVLDYGGVGKVSNVFVVLTPAQRSADELRAP